MGECRSFPCGLFVHVLLSCDKAAAPRPRPRCLSPSVATRREKKKLMMFLRVFVLWPTKDLFAISPSWNYALHLRGEYQNVGGKCKKLIEFFNYAGLYYFV